jgi:predicted permease
MNKLVFHVLIPAMMFVNIYNMEDVSSLSFTYVLYGLGMTMVIFFAMLPLTACLTRERNRRGVLAQGAFRSNYSLVGLPLVLSVCGESGIPAATLMLTFATPLYNILAVFVLSYFGGGKSRPSIGKILLGICKNPLIQAVAAGFLMIGIRALFTEWDIAFRLTDITPLFRVLNYLSDAATPLALLSLGAQFEFSAISGLSREITAGVLLRNLIVPVLGIGCALLFFRFNAAQYAALVALFVTPVAVSSAPMAQEMGGDGDLAGQLVIWTTVFSALSPFLTIYLLRVIEIF